MSDLEVHPVAEPIVPAPGLSQVERVTSIFSAPSKTFEDIKRGNKSWWLPFLIMVVFGYIFFAVIATKVTMQTVVDNQSKLMSESQQEKMAQMPPEQRAMAAKWTLYITEGVFAVSPVFVIIKALIVALVLWGTINFVFGGKATFGSVFSVWFFANLPQVVGAILGIVIVFVGNSPETFNIKNFAPTNVAALLYPNPAEANKALYALTSAIDAISIWSLILMGIGIAIVAGVKRSSGYIAVFGWWALVVIVSVGWAAAFG